VPDFVATVDEKTDDISSWSAFDKDTTALGLEAIRETDHTGQVAWRSAQMPTTMRSDTWRLSDRFRERLKIRVDA
jgi:hypothetical protein